MNCPVCKKDVVEAFQVWSDKPFTAKEALPGLAAWGGLDVPRTIICQNKQFVHFRFDRSGEEHLVEMVPNLPDRRETIREHYESLIRPCEHDGCANNGNPAWSLFGDPEPLGWYCDDHAYEHGVCPVCRYFLAGSESFDFSKNGMCADCFEMLQQEMGEFDDEMEDEFADDLGL